MGNTQRADDYEDGNEEEEGRAQFTCKQLQHFRKISRCDECVHYIGCPFWMTILLLNNERTGPFMKMMLPDIEKSCIMFIKNMFARNGGSND